ncbi:MAG TPA: glycosyltransferase [Vicinamibacterales bacterium]|nr:glycosyltransferase [Vicinamibacterales bacterium]
MARALARRGHQVKVAGGRKTAARAAGVDYVPNATLADDLRRRPCDLFLSCRHHDILNQPIAARMVGLWYHDHVDSYRGGDPLRARSRASFSLFLSRYHLEGFARRIRGLAPYAEVTSNGVDFQAVDAVLAARAADRPLTFAYASRPERGLDYLLREVWPAIRARYPDAELLISTYEGPRPPASELARHYALCDHLARETPGVVTLGALPRREFWRRLAECRALLYPASFPEVSCMVALEAQALGVPVVTTDAFALSETVACQDTRVAGPCRSREYLRSFLDIVSRLVDDPPFLASVRAAGRRHVRPETHSWDAIAASWEAMVETRFAHRFERHKAGVLRRLLREEDPVLVGRALSGSPGELPLEARVQRTPPLPKVSATILVKNEESHLRRCIESIAPVADEIIIGDTGSTDLTADIARSLGFERYGGHGEPPPRRIVDIEFEDFAQARNALARHADGDYIFWQDADEVLVNGALLRSWIDDNVFFDALKIEQRHVMAFGSLASDFPSRCFRPDTPEGRLAWYGCIHEIIEAGENMLPQRMATLPDIVVLHTGYVDPQVVESKRQARNHPLLLKDRRLHPARYPGFTYGMRTYLQIAQREIAAAGRVTQKAYLYLNLGYEIWHHHVRHFPFPYQQHAFEFSRQILEELARHRLALRVTGEVPIEADFGFAGNRGLIDIAPADIPRARMCYATVDELRQALLRRCHELDVALAPGLGTELPPDAPLETAQSAGDVLDPALFGLTANGDPIGPMAYVEPALPEEARPPATTRLELPAELFQVE